MRADRLLSLMLSLQTEGRLTAEVLAQRFEVSERTIYRDVEALSMAGIPIYTQTGVNGGIFLDEHYRTSLTGFSLNELRALFVAADAGPLADLGLQQAAQGTLLKLLAALPTAHQQEVERLRKRFYIDSARWFDYQEMPSLLPDLQQAVWEDRQIVIHYSNYEGKASEQALDAYALVAKANVWYLIARTPDGGYRTYRAARIAALSLLNAHFQRDSAFDPVEFWQEMTRSFEKMRQTSYPFYPALLRVTAAALSRLRELLPDRVEQGETDAAHDWVTVRALFLSPDEACMVVLALMNGARVLEPDALRIHVLAAARAALAAHEMANDAAHS